MDFEETQKKDIIGAIKNDNLYDFIACNYWRLENNVIIELLKECIYILTTCNGYEEKQKQLIDNLKDFQGWRD